MSEQKKPNTERRRNIGDPEDMKDIDRVTRKRRSLELGDIHTIMSTENGRRHMWRMLRMTHIFSTSFTGSSETFFKEGERNVGLKLLADIQEICPDLYFTMTVEAQKRDRDEEIESNRNVTTED